MAKKFYSNGKLLLTGEYAVLEGALSLAVPTKYGQSLSVKEIDSHELIWKSWDEMEKIWFEGTFGLLPPGHTSQEQSSFFPYFDCAQHRSREGRATFETLSKILRETRKLNPYFLRDAKGYAVDTRLTFPRDWGLGSSSTLINNISQWAEVDAYQLLWNTFSGSGYDVACAKNDHPILYCLEDGQPNATEVHFNPAFQDNLFFIHLNKKQNSREGIARYRKMVFDKPRLVQKVSEITRKTVSCESLSEFESLMTDHETLLSQILQMPTVKESLFPDFEGAIKSLGAWGGDFILATGDGETPSYFERLGYGTVLPYGEMVLEPGG